MVLVDYNYPLELTKEGKEVSSPFELDNVFYANRVKASGWEVKLPLELLGERMMLIFVDIYGNEYSELKSLADFNTTSQENVNNISQDNYSEDSNSQLQIRS